jgi:hypothetical protein
MDVVKFSKLLTRLEAAIGIEPMNKSFADRLAHVSSNITEYHRA